MGQRPALQDRLIHACELTVVTCIDHRLHGDGRIGDALRREFGAGVRYDFLTMPGACRRLLHEGTERRDGVLKDLELSVSLHAPETIVLVPHTDCGAYASAGFKNPAQEFAGLVGDINAATDVLRARFERLTVLGFVAIVEGGDFVRLEPISSPPMPMTRSRTAARSRAD